MLSNVAIAAICLVPVVATIIVPTESAAKTRHHAAAHNTTVHNSAPMSGAVPSDTGSGAWVCNAYGYGGVRNVWQTVTGPLSATRAEAEAAAVSDCRLNACRPRGCWQH